MILLEYFYGVLMVFQSILKGFKVFLMILLGTFVYVQAIFIVFVWYVYGTFIKVYFWSTFRVFLGHFQDIHRVFKFFLKKYSVSLLEPQFLRGRSCESLGKSGYKKVTGLSDGPGVGPTLII